MHDDPVWWDGHQVVLTSSKHAQRRSVTSWARAGLAHGERLVYVADDLYPTTTKLVSSLAEEGLDQLAADQLEVIEPSRFYSTTGYARLVAEALDNGYPGVRSYGSPSVAASVLNPVEFDQFERLLQETWAERSVTALCRYDRPAHGERHQLTTAVARHPSGCSETTLHGRWLAPGRLELAGEVDLSNDDVLAAILDNAVAAVLKAHDSTDAPDHAGTPDDHPAAGVEPAVVLEIGCAELMFVSASGWRRFAAAGEALQAAGSTLRLFDLPAVPAQVVHVLGLHHILGCDR